MKKVFLLSLLALISPSTFPAEDISRILSLSPGMKLDPKIKLEHSTKSYTYLIEKDQDLIHAVDLEFSTPQEPRKYVDPETEGFCLRQPRKGDVNLDRYFFFDKKTTTRYELSSEKKLISIHIQKMPGAREHAKCTLRSFNVTGGK
jgi:hypothetical protein